MKLSMLMSAAVLAISAPAIAQDTGQMAPPPPPAGAQADQPAPPPPAPPTPNDMSAQQMPQSGQMPPADGAAPAEPMPPAPPAGAGAPMPPAPPAAEAAPPPAPRADYPVCSKTVTDSCINPSEVRKAKRRR